MCNRSYKLYIRCYAISLCKQTHRNKVGKAAHKLSWNSHGWVWTQTGLNNTAGVSAEGESLSLHRQKSIKAELSAEREACWVIPERLLLSSGQMRSITGSQERDTEESVARRGCGEAEKFGKSLLQMRREKNQHLFIHLDSSFTRAQTPTCLTQLQRVKERISLLFLTLHPSSLALSPLQRQ